MASLSAEGSEIHLDNQSSPCRSSSCLDLSSTDFSYLPSPTSSLSSWNPIFKETQWRPVLRSITTGKKKPIPTPWGLVKPTNAHTKSANILEPQVSTSISSRWRRSRPSLKLKPAPPIPERSEPIPHGDPEQSSTCCGSANVNASAATAAGRSGSSHVYIRSWVRCKHSGRLHCNGYNLV